MVEDKLATESDPDPFVLLANDEDPVPDATDPDAAATFCDDELLVSVLKAFIHLVFIPAAVAPPPLPPDKLNLLPR